MPSYRHSPRYVRNINVTHVTNVTQITTIVNNTNGAADRRDFANRKFPHAVTVVPASVVTSRAPVAAEAARVRTDPQVRALVADRAAGEGDGRRSGRGAAGPGQAAVRQGRGQPPAVGRAPSRVQRPSRPGTRPGTRSGARPGFRLAGARAAPQAGAAPQATPVPAPGTARPARVRHRKPVPRRKRRRNRRCAAGRATSGRRRRPAQRRKPDRLPTRLRPAGVRRSRLAGRRACRRRLLAPKRPRAGAVAAVAATTRARRRRLPRLRRLPRSRMPRRSRTLPRNRTPVPQADYARTGRRAAAESGRQRRSSRRRTRSGLAAAVAAVPMTRLRQGVRARCRRRR